MQHKGFVKYLSLEYSASNIKNENKKFGAFSLGEMLMVLLIMSFIAIGIPGIHFKKSEMKTKRSLHGRYECYYACPLVNGADGKKVHSSGCAADAYLLYQYSVSEEGAATGPDNVAKCVFTPPKNAIFYLVHAVGGGGGSSTYNGSYTLSSNQTETRYYYSPNDFPKWLRDVQGANQLPAGATTFNTSVKASKATIRYGRSGKAGETMSLFFPRLRDLEIEMYPGKGGARGAAGSKTEVWFNMASATGIKRTKVIEVDGGAAGSGSGSTVIWVDGENTMCVVKDNDEVGYRAADFSGNVELDKGSLMESKMEEVEFGSGGAGSYGNVTQTTSANYYVNGYNVSAYVQKPDCIEPRVCGDGTTSNPCVGQAGRNGAVVILW